MFKKLKTHWKVNTSGLWLILFTFAITGSLTAWLSKKVAEWMLLEKYGFGWWMSKILILIFGYQVIILIVGFCLGMFSFFWRYEKKILSRFGILKPDHSPLQVPNDDPHTNTNQGEDIQKQKINIAIFASGNGSNAAQLIAHFKNNDSGRIALIVCNRPGAGVIDVAKQSNVPLLMIQSEKFFDTGYLEELLDNKINFIALAGFLWKIPSQLINHYKGKIVNLHPALLPRFGGKGMHGKAVHTAVIQSGEKKSGITIHQVDDQYDHGTILYQESCEVEVGETSETLSKKIQELEHMHYGVKVEEILKKING